MRKKNLNLGVGLMAVILAALIFMSVSGEPITIKGYIYDVNNEPLIGASVIEKGTTNGTITNIDGYYSLIVSSNLARLIVSYTGFESEEIVLSNKTISEPIKTNLTAGAKLEEIVVTGRNRLKLLQGRLAGKNKSKKSNRSYEKYESELIVGCPIGMVQDLETDFNTEDYDAITENTFLSTNAKPVSTFSIDVDAASYSNLRRYIDHGQQPPKDAVRIEEMVNYFDYNYPQPDGVDPFEVITEYSDCPWNTKNKLIHIGLQGKEIPKENLPASNLVFLCDVSGSMNSHNKLPLLQSSLKMLVNNLRPEDKVSLVVYAGSTGVVLEPTSGEDKGKIRAAIDKLSTGGGTGGAAGIKMAYKQARSAFIEGGNNRVLLATDGDFNLGISSDAELVRLIEQERESGVFLTVMGFGTGNYKDNKMEKLANHGNGNYAYIDNISEARKVLVSEFGGTLFTIAKDVKLQIEFNPKHVAAYRLIGYENRMLAREDFNDDKKDAGELGAGHTVTAMYEIIPIGVESNFVKSVDPLKYQIEKKKPVKSFADELMTVKLRYKQPDGKVSKLISKAVSTNTKDLDSTSDNFRWAATVAGFGMLLRDSEFKQEADYDLMIAMGQSSLGADKEGFRKEMIKMMKNMGAMAQPIEEYEADLGK